ncbi:TPA: hypothetical protein DCX16_04360 [bacterium]|nr:hypothetical protein [bacterium]
MPDLHQRKMIKILLFLGLFSIAYGDDRIVAWIDDEIITKKELEDIQKKGLDKNEALYAMIDQILLTKEAKRIGISISEGIVEERMRELPKGVQTDEISLKKKISDEFLRMRLLNIMRKRIGIEEEEILSNLNGYKEEVRIDFLAFENEEDANKSFLELTKDRVTTYRIQNLDFLCPLEMKKEFFDVCLQLEEGRISHPFPMDDKFYIIIMKEKRDTPNYHLKKIRDEFFIEVMGRVKPRKDKETREEILLELASLIEEKIKEERFEETFFSFISKLRKNAYIVMEE